MRARGERLCETRTWDHRGWGTVKSGIEAGAPERRSVVPCQEGEQMPGQYGVRRVIVQRMGAEP